MRIYQPVSLATHALLALDPAASHHVARVLRAKVGDSLIVFNGESGDFEGTISAIDKKTVSVTLQKEILKNTESPLNLCLAQGISRGEKMDYTIQKAVELGVKKIVPLFTERCTVKLDEDRREKRYQHWRAIMISACEQSGRNQIPELLPLQSLSQWIKNNQSDVSFVLAPAATSKLKQIPIPAQGSVSLLIGPEGGLSENEINQASAQGFCPLNLGPRILRTETAAVAALTALQCFFGDLGG